jgi:hypothetical protein
VAVLCLHLQLRAKIFELEKWMLREPSSFLFSCFLMMTARSNFRRSVTQQIMGGVYDTPFPSSLHVGCVLRVFIAPLWAISNIFDSQSCPASLTEFRLLNVTTTSCVSATAWLLLGFEWNFCGAILDTHWFPAGDDFLLCWCSFEGFVMSRRSYRRPPFIVSCCS